MYRGVKGCKKGIENRLQRLQDVLYLGYLAYKTMLRYNNPWAIKPG